MFISCIEESYFGVSYMIFGNALSSTFLAMLSISSTFEGLQYNTTLPAITGANTSNHRCE